MLVAMVVGVFFCRGVFCGETGSSLVSFHFIADTERPDTTKMKLKGKTEELDVENTAQLSLFDLDSVSVERQNWKRTSQDAAAKLGLQLSSCRLVFKFNASGKEKLNQITGANIGRRLGIIVSGELVKSFKIREPIIDGEMEISGMFSEEEAESVAGEITKVLSKEKSRY
jgi:preprotein translocase subunit SecD